MELQKENEERYSSSFYFRLKALIATPKVQPKYVFAISKKYPTMRSLLNEYLDPQQIHKWFFLWFLLICFKISCYCLQVHEKEFILKDLIIEGELGKEDKRLGEVCSHWVDRILVAQNGTSKTDEVNDGADFFCFLVLSCMEVALFSISLVAIILVQHNR